MVHLMNSTSKKIQNLLEPLDEQTILAGPQPTDIFGGGKKITTFCFASQLKKFLAFSKCF